MITLENKIFNDLKEEIREYEEMLSKNSIELGKTQAQLIYCNDKINCLNERIKNLENVIRDLLNEKY